MPLPEIRRGYLILRPLHAGGVHIWVAERGEFELPVPISEQPDDNMMSGPRRPDEVLGIARGSNARSTVGNSAEPSRRGASLNGTVVSGVV
jgi:hypothetical protein